MTGNCPQFPSLRAERNLTPCAGGPRPHLADLAALERLRPPSYNRGVLRVTILSPDRSVEYSFYDNLTFFAAAGGRSLGHEVEVLTLTNHTDREGWADQLLAHGRSLLSRATPPGCVILPNYMGTAETLAPELADAGIDCFVVAEGAPPHVRGIVGQIVPDDAAAGELLARGLLKRARAKLGDRELRAAILAGDHTAAGTQRFHGWSKAAAADGAVEVVGFQYGAWQRSIAESQTARLLRDFPTLDLVWAASDAMAIGAADAADRAGRRLGRDLFVGGIDFDREALRRVRDRDQALSVGGHFLDGARAILALHERERGGWIAGTTLASPWLEVDATRAADYLDLVERRALHGLDLRPFTRERGGRLEDLSLEALLPR